MSVAVSSKRYAQAIFKIARENNNFDIWKEDLGKIATLMEDTRVTTVLENPKIPFDQKKTLVDKALEKVNPMALNLAYLLILKGKVKNATHIYEEYECLLDEYNGIKRARVITSIPLDERDKPKLSRQLEHITGNKLRIIYEVNPEILGGFIARINGTLIDASLRSKLIALKNRISSTTK